MESSTTGIVLGQTPVPTIRYVFRLATPEQLPQAASSLQSKHRCGDVSNSLPLEGKVLNEVKQMRCSHRSGVIPFLSRSLRALHLIRVRRLTHLPLKGKALCYCRLERTEDACPYRGRHLTVSARQDTTIHSSPVTQKVRRPVLQVAVIAYILLR